MFRTLFKHMFRYRRQRREEEALRQADLERGHWVDENGVDRWPPDYTVGP